MPATVSLERALGMILAQDVRPAAGGSPLPPRFRQGHVLTAPDLAELAAMGVREIKALPAQPEPPASSLDPGLAALADKLVEASARMHGHLCAGQIIGVRMSILGLSLLGYSCPLVMPDIKNVVGFVEIERCLADAVAVASGLRFGRGSLKLVNLGLLAATFLDLPSGRAVRVVSREEARELALAHASRARNVRDAQLAAYRIMSDEELFSVSWVKVRLPESEMPGARPAKISCQRCGILVRSGQIREQDGRKLCAPCAGQAYFSQLDSEE